MHDVGEITIFVGARLVGQEIEVAWVKDLLLGRGAGLGCLDLESKLVTDGFQNFWDNFLDTFSKTEEAALNVLVVIPEYLIKLIEKLNLLLYRSHPPKI